eukprot:4331270-Amphidinium_carterae.1
MDLMDFLKGSPVFMRFLATNNEHSMNNEYPPRWTPKNDFEAPNYLPYSTTNNHYNNSPVDNSGMLLRL